MSQVVAKSSVKVGDLVKYKAYHLDLQHLIGIVADVNDARDRAQMLWSDPTRNWVWDWVNELELVSECR